MVLGKKVIMCFNLKKTKCHKGWCNIRRTKTACGIYHIWSKQILKIILTKFGEDTSGNIYERFKDAECGIKIGRLDYIR